MSFTLTAADGTEATVSDWGATLTRLLVPNAEGRRADVVLGFDDAAGYRDHGAYFGATVGRYGNRIRGGKFAIDGLPVAVTCNEGANHLHGGTTGYDRRFWASEADDSANAVTFRLVSPDLDEGFPGRLDVSVRYAVAPGTLSVTMTATTDRPTVCNLVHHSYFNLAGHDAGTVLDHDLTVRADFYTPSGDDLLPTGEVRAVAGTPFDFRSPKPIGRDQGDGPGAVAVYDHNWCLCDYDGRLREVAILEHRASGRRMALWSDQPGLQVYTGGYLGPSIVGKGGHPCRRFAGVALETQRYPDSPNLTHFPSPVLRPGETYAHRMEFRFAPL